MVSESNISAKKRRANRLNARKSTGPRSAEGKARSAQNARVHGVFCKDVVLEGEDAAEFNNIRRRFIERLRPQDHLELSLVERVAEGNWRLMRLNRHEADQEWENAQSSALQKSEDQTMTAFAAQMIGGLGSGRGLGRVPAAAFRACEAQAAVIDPYGSARQRAEQSISRALRELRMLQSPNKPADLQPSPFLDVDDSQQEENPQNEPTAAESPATDAPPETCGEPAVELMKIASSLDVPAAPPAPPSPASQDNQCNSPDAPSGQT